MQQDYSILPTGAKMPMLGLGTWQSFSYFSVTDESELSTALRAAIDAGYRLIDTAFLYSNETIIGNVLHEYISTGKVRRDEFFIVTKLPFTGHASKDVAAIVAGQLKALRIDYIDLYLIHVPTPFQASYTYLCRFLKSVYKKMRKGSFTISCSNLSRRAKMAARRRKSNGFAPLIKDGKMVPDEIDHLQTWHALEEQFQSGNLKAIGLSNFNEKQIQRIYDVANVKPHNLQVEAHLYWPQHKLFEFCKQRNISFTAYSPIGSPGRRASRPDGDWPEGDQLSDPLVVELAKQYSKTPAQILLRYLIQRGISVLPKSTKPERIRENINVFDFTIDSGDMQKLEAVAKRVRLFTFDMVNHHPWFPFHD